MTAKEWLNRGRALDKEINELVCAKTAAWDKALRFSSDADGERVQTTRRNTSEEKYISYAEYSAMIDERVDELYTVKREILTAVNKVGDATLRTLLIARYVNFKTWERIAYEMHFSREWITKRLHPRALSEIEKIVPFSSH